RHAPLRRVIAALDATAGANQHVQVTPAVRAVELATVTVETFGAESLIETIRRTRRLAEEQHGSNTPAQELTGHGAQQEPADALSLHALKRVDLVQLAGKARHAAVVGCAFRERYQLALLIPHDETKPAVIRDRERLAPLALSQLAGWT